MRSLYKQRMATARGYPWASYLPRLVWEMGSPRIMGCRFFVSCVLLAAVGVTAIGAAGAAVAPRPLVTAVGDAELPPADYNVFLNRVHTTGATMIRLSLDWRAVAGATAPISGEAGDPAWPGYQWAAFDARVTAVAARGLVPIVDILGAPTWARGAPLPGATTGTGVWRPSASALGEFALAAATRYSGSFGGLPRVGYWEVWNEPNLSTQLTPQFVGKRPFSPGLYRDMVNAVAAAVKGVDPTNVVIAGSTAPFRDITPTVQKVSKDWGPLTFMRDLLCLSPKLKPTCSNPIHFDVWSHHPYTSGGPLHHANLPDDVSLGDLPKVRRVLDAAQRVHHIVSNQGRPRFWVTEFSWDSSPPDPRAVPMGLLTRWTSEALYQMWRNGVTMVTWFQLRDDPIATSYYQSGLYFRGFKQTEDKPKPILRAFRFPFVAYPTKSAVSVWGRTPFGLPGKVLVQQRVGRGWVQAGRLTSDAVGIFRGVLPLHGRDNFRAVLAATGERSAQYSLVEPRDRFFNPFGIPAIFEPGKH